MDLQAILFPKPEICMEEHLYYHRNYEKVTLDTEKSVLLFQENGLVTFDSYFNGFSIGKWKKYTILDTLNLRIRLSGKFQVRLINHELVNRNIISKVIVDEIVEASNAQDFEFSFKGFSQKGMHMFALYALEDDAVFYGGTYFTDDIDISQLVNVKLALNMCTFRKEEFIYRNVATLQKELIENPQSPLYHQLQLYITDNAMTLDESKLDSPYIHLTKQNAFGSVGGFTRGVMGILKEKEQYGYTHAIFLDDDILIAPEVLCRNLMLLRMMKPAYRDAWVGGGMLGLDFPNTQTESGGCYGEKDYVGLKAYVDLNSLYNVLFNEIEEGAQINAWWYCCIPLSTIDEQHLPYPVYFHCDDMEYAIRQCKKLILLNGISVWHEEFFYKPDTHYYDGRNREILIALHFPELARKWRAKKRLISKVGKQLLNYRYKDAKEILTAMQDFLKGPDWLTHTDDRAKFEAVVKNRFMNEPIEKLDYPFDYNKYIQSLAPPQESRWMRIFRRITLNGWILPATPRKNPIVIAGTPLIYNFFRAKRVLNYSAKTNSGYITVKSYKKVAEILGKLLYTFVLIDKHYSSAVVAYQNSLPVYTTSDYWERIFQEKV